MEEGLGFRFWARLAGIVVLGGIVAMIFFLIFSRAIYAFGFLGGFLLLAAVLLVFAWFHDRRQQREYDSG